MDFAKETFHDFPRLLSYPKNYSRTFQILTGKGTFIHDIPDCMNPDLKSFTSEVPTIPITYIGLFSYFCWKIVFGRNKLFLF